jgi:DNA-binding GntR family transcriptional regulator
MRPVDPTGNPHFAYLQVADDLAARLTAGEFPRKLPAERELARQYEVAYATARRAMEVLRGRELILTRQGRGTFPARRDQRTDG